MSKFGDGSVAAIETRPWDLSAAQEAIGEENLGIAVYPTVTIGGNTVQQKAFLGVKLFAVNQAPAGSDTDRIAASYKLASMLTSAESQEKQFTYEGRNIIPANKEVQESDTVQSNELAQAVIKMASSSDYTVVTPKLSQMTTFWTESVALLSDVYNGKIQSSDYLTKLQEFDADLAAEIDGASKFQIFKSITFPQILLVMMPNLIQQFIGNINNFNVIYLLTGGGPTNSNFYQAGSTDLLVTWLYNLTVTAADYNLASVIGIIIFVLSAVFSLLAYTRTSSYKEGVAK